MTVDSYQSVYVADSLQDDCKKIGIPDAYVESDNVFQSFEGGNQSFYQIPNGCQQSNHSKSDQFETVTTSKVTDVSVMKERHSDIYFYSKIPVEDLPNNIKTMFLSGIKASHPNDSNLPTSTPIWLDINKVKKGQDFAKKFFYAVNYGEMLSLLFLFSSPNGINPLIFTDKSHTPFLAYKRYLSTTLRVKSWYETDFWIPGSIGYKNLKAVRSLHLNVARKINDPKNTLEIKRKVDLEAKTKLWCPLINNIRADMRQASGCPYAVFDKERIYLNQFEMALTQTGFFGLIVLFPQKLGARNATEEELEAFVHLWRYLGYMLGIKDEYNVCNGSYSEVKSRLKTIYEVWVKPTFSQVSREWEHMSRSAIIGINIFTNSGVTFEKAFLYLCYLFDFDVPNTSSRISRWNLVTFQLEKYIMTHIHLIPGMGNMINYVIRNKIKEAQNVSPEWIKKVEGKNYYTR